MTFGLQFWQIVNKILTIDLKISTDFLILPKYNPQNSIADSHKLNQIPWFSIFAF